MLDKYFTYNEILPIDKVMVTLDDRAGHFERLSEDMSTYGNRFGFHFRAVRFSCPPPDDLRLSHLILITHIQETPCFWDELKNDLNRIADMYSSATICISYQNSSAFRDAGKTIDTWKLEFGPSINFLRPDDRSDPVLPNYTKILDNSVCDTVRVKYKAVRRNLSLDCPATVRTFFNSCSSLYSDHELYHRASTDGFFCCKYDDLIFITSTRTNKIQFDISRTAVIHQYDEKTNEVTYSGPFLPSSDSVEACVLLSRMPHLTAILHTHASEKITRNPKMRSHILVPPLPYGERDLGHSIADALISRERTWGILDDHGEVFTASDVDLTKAFIEIERVTMEALHEGL